MAKTENLHCQDCEFLLSHISSTQTPDQCIFCGNKRFYYESPFGLRFLGRDSVCYVCDAHYKNTRIDDPEPRFSMDSFEEAQQLPYKQQLKARANAWY